MLNIRILNCYEAKIQIANLSDVFTDFVVTVDVSVKPKQRPASYAVIRMIGAG